MAVKYDEGRARWYVEFQQAGSRVFRRLPPKGTREQAQALETQLRRDLFDRGQLGKRDEITLPAAIQLWLNHNARKNQRKALSEAKQWVPFVEGKLLREAPEVAAGAMREWNTRNISDQRLAWKMPLPGGGTLPHPRSTRSCTAATINRRLCVLKAAAKLAWRQGLIPDNISGRITLLKEQNQREVYLTKAEVSTLAQHSTQPQAIWLAAYTGLRASELLALPKCAQSTLALSVAASQSKTGRPRSVPVPKPARPYLSALPLGLSYWQLHKEFNRARDAAGMSHVRFHDLRHTCASWLINAGVDLYVVGAILGHTTTQTTARYSHLAQGTLKAAMAKLR